jgi:hypothetical protein
MEFLMGVSEVDLAYAAGIIDGEGTICICHIRRPKCNPDWENRLLVEVNTTDNVIVPWLKSTFGSTVHLQKATRPGCKNSNRWVCTHRRAVAFLQLVMPYLKLKKTQAVLAINFQGSKNWGGKNRWYRKTQEEIDFEDKCLKEMKALNKRGTL